MCEHFTTSAPHVTLAPRRMQRQVTMMYNEMNRLLLNAHVRGHDGRRGAPSTVSTEAPVDAVSTISTSSSGTGDLRVYV